MREFSPTHRATVVATSEGDDPNIQLEVRWEPLVDGGEDIEYDPAAYTFIQNLLMYVEQLVGDNLEIEEGLVDKQRLN